MAPNNAKEIAFMSTKSKYFHLGLRSAWLVLVLVSLLSNGPRNYRLILSKQILPLKNLRQLAVVVL